jgi:hypothetical protein
MKRQISSNMSFAFCTMGIVLAVWVIPAAADTHTVLSGQSIQTAINAAANGDAIEVKPGTYKEAIDFKGKAVRLYSNGGPSVTTINGNNAYHVVKCVTGETAATILDGFTITGGKAVGSADNDTLGGGMLNVSSSPTVTRCIFVNNTALDGGGGMANYNGSSPTVVNCVFRSNSVTFDALPIGGGMLNLGSVNPTVTNCTFYANTATAGGAAIYNWGGGARATVTNCILWGNNGGGEPQRDEIGLMGGTITLTSSVVEQGTGQSWFGAGCIDADPMFVNAAGGDFGLGACSLCVDAGNNAAVPAGVTRDLAGNPRFFDDVGLVDSGIGTAPIVDIGVFERQESSYPRIYNKTKGSRYCYSSIQLAIDHAANGDQIEVTPGIYYESINFKGKAIRLYSSGRPEFTIIDGTGFYHVVQCVSGETANTILEGFTIFGGNANGPADLDKCGGGMLIVSSNPTVTHCIFSSNSATSGGGIYNKSGSPTISACTFQANSTANGIDYAISRSGRHGNHGGNAGHGGGMYNDSASPTISDCQFTLNRTGNGGKGQNGSSGGFLSNGGWGGNGGNGGYGAGMYNQNSGPRITNCYFNGNQTGAGGQAGNGGGEGWGLGYDHSGGTGGIGGSGGNGSGIYNNESTSIVADCEFINNSTGLGAHGGNAHNAGGDGGGGGWGGHGAGIHSYLGSLDLTNGVFGGNKTGSGGGGGDTDWDIFSDAGTGGNGGSGGGICNDGNTGKVTNCTFYRNGIGGGGEGGTGSYLNGGNPGEGGGICNFNTSNLSFFVTNCILRENSREFNFYKSQTVTAANCNIHQVMGGLVPGCINADPHFVDISSPDLNLCNLRLQPDSPCIDTGSNEAPVLSETDKDGYPRIIDGDCDRTARADMGAYEFNYIGEGDFNYTCGVDLEDLLLFAESWMTQPGDPAWNWMRDISDPKDQRIDLSDFAVLAENWYRIDSYRIYRNKLDSNPGWRVEGQWAFGQPTGSGGSSMGNPDPTSGNTGANVYGVNLSGDYTVALGGPYSLTTGPIDCRGYHDLKLAFARWLNIDGPGYVLCTVDVSIDGNAWTAIWQNDSVVTDSVWTSVEYDVDPVADNQETVYFRWTYKVVDRAYPCSGWNIDDIELYGKR